MRHSGRQGVREVVAIHAEFAAEMARQVVFEAYGEDAYTKGLTVWTTLRRVDQEAAYAAVRRGVLEYDRRHGYRGPEAYANLPRPTAEAEQVLDRVFAETPDGDNLAGRRRARGEPAEVKAMLASGDTIAVTGEGCGLPPGAVRQVATEPANPARRGHPGARDDKGRYGIARCRRSSRRSCARSADGAVTR